MAPQQDNSPEVLTPWGGIACGAQKRQGPGQCTRPAGEGTSHLGYGRCKLHGGSTRNHRMSTAMQEALDQATRVMGAPLDIDPMDALLWCVRITAGEVAYSTWRIETGVDEEDAVGNPVTHSETSRSGSEESYEETADTFSPPELHIWIRVRQDAVARLAKYSKMALDAGIAERAVQIAEEAGERLAVAIRSILESLDLSVEQERKAPEIVSSALRLLEQAPETIEGRETVHQ